MVIVAEFAMPEVNAFMARRQWIDSSCIDRDARKRTGAVPPQRPHAPLFAANCFHAVH